MEVQKAVRCGCAGGACVDALTVEKLRLLKSVRNNAILHPFFLLKPCEILQKMTFVGFFEGNGETMMCGEVFSVQNVACADLDSCTMDFHLEVDCLCHGELRW